MPNLVANMEIKVYLNQSAWRNHKAILCRRVECPDVFDYHQCVNVMKSLYGNECVLEFIVV